MKPKGAMSDLRGKQQFGANALSSSDIRNALGSRRSEFVVDSHGVVHGFIPVTTPDSIRDWYADVNVWQRVDSKEGNSGGGVFNIIRLAHPMKSPKRKKRIKEPEVKRKSKK